jgi:hypothetical protein
MARIPQRKRAWAFVAMTALAAATACGDGGDSGTNPGGPSPAEPSSVAIPAPSTTATCEPYAGAWSAVHGAPSPCANVQGATTVGQQMCRLTFTIPNVGDLTLDVNGAAGQAYVRLPGSCATADTSVVPGRLEVRGANEILVLFGNGTACCRHGSVTLRR